MVIVAQATDWSEVATQWLGQAFWLQIVLLGGQPTSWNLVAVLGLDWRYVCLQSGGHMVTDPVVTTVDPVPRRKVGPVVAVTTLVTFPAP